jgi:hypothetical protein
VISLYKTLLAEIDCGSDTVFRLLPTLLDAQLAANPDIERMLPQHGIAFSCGKSDLQVRPLSVAAWRAGKAGAIYNGTPVAVYRSSGTTSTDRSATVLDQEGLALYSGAVKSGFSTTFGYSGEPILALMPDATSAPESSLSAMCDILGAHFVFGDRWQERLIRHVAVATEPLVLFGTAFAWVHFLDATSGKIDLPKGSRLIETGGYKGKSRELPKAELYEALATRLGLSTDDIWSEYGMCELSSQFYSKGLGRRLLPSPSIRSVAISPITGAACDPGEDGLLVHIDAANWCTYAVIETQDWGNVDASGHVDLKGRAPGAHPKGCSIDADTP